MGRSSVFGSSVQTRRGGEALHALGCNTMQPSKLSQVTGKLFPAPIGQNPLGLLPARVEDENARMRIRVAPVCHPSNKGS